MEHQGIGFIGTGQMATALARGFARAGLARSDLLVGSDPSAEARERFAEATGARTTDDNSRAIAQCGVLFLAVKPQQLPAVLAELGQLPTGNLLIVSIAAGVRLATLTDALGPAARLVRVMPNTPCLVGEGASAFCLGGAATPDDAARVKELLESVGVAYQVEEKLMDAVTGLSGSGPAYVYMMIEALSDGGVRAGLPRAVATALAAQTLLGAARMVLATGEHPGVLKDRVASPGGTTIAGIEALEEHGLRASLMAAVAAATRRSQELGS